MLQSITGLPAEAFKDKEEKDVTLSGVQGDFGGGQISINDLLDPLHGKAGYSMLRKRLHQLEKMPMAVQAPLPKVERDKLERKVTYVQSKKEMNKWEPLVKRNRETPSLYLGEDIDLGMHTVGTIAAEHKPQTEFKRKIAALIGDPLVMEAHSKDGARLLELNKERSLKKQREAAHEEACLALQEYESSLGKLEGDEAGPSSPGKRSGRRVFVGAKSRPMTFSTEEPKNHDDNDSEGEVEVREEENEHKVENGLSEVQIGPALVPDDAETGQEAIFKDFDDIVKNAGSKTTYEVSIFASDTWRKMGGKNPSDNIKEKSAVADNLVLSSQNSAGQDDNSDSDSDLEIVDGFLSSHPKSDDYKLPSQDELIHRAFAGDDVVMEFEKEKMDVLNEENPEPEKPVLLPGWGQWTHLQQKKGIPSIITEEHEKAKRKREEALKKRKDSHLKNVIISEKIDKKAEKLHLKNLPFPYTSKEAYEQSIRMPIGPDYNPAISIGALNRPAVIKRAGVIINPIKYEDIDPYGKSEDSKEPKNKRQKKKPNAKKTQFAGRKVSKKS